MSFRFTTQCLGADAFSCLFVVICALGRLNLKTIETLQAQLIKSQF